jgi:hypothetical protein
LNKIEEQSLTNYLTGYELKHKLLKDEVLIADDELKGKQIKVEKEVDLNSTNQVRNLAQRFFEKFNVVKNIEYKSEDKTRIIQKEFIDRKRILRIFENGKIEYTSAEIPSDNSQVDKYTALKTAIEFIQKTSSLPKNSYVSEIKELGNSDYIICFDYTIEGLKVKISGQELPEHAIEIEVKGNIISSYKRLVKNVDVSKDKEINVQNLKAIDEAVKEYRQKTGIKDINKAVKEVSLVYADDGVKSGAYPNWYIQIDNQSFLINSVAEEN